MSVSRKSAFLYSAFSSYANLLVTSISVIILSRILTPEEIGLYSVTAVLIGALGIIRNAGVTEYLIQKKQILPLDIKTSFGFLIITTWPLCALIFFSRYAIAEFYDNESMVQLVEILCINFLIAPLGAPAYAILRREMNFRLLALITFITTVIESVAAIVLALNEWSYLSLALANLANGIISVVLFILFRPQHCFVIPTFSGFKPYFQFGIPLLGANLSNYLNSYGTELIVGKSLGVSSVAFLNRANSIKDLVTKIFFSSINLVTMPLLSETIRNSDNVHHHFFRLTNLLLVFSVPALFVVYILSEEIIVLLFGQQWLPSVPLLKILCLASAIWFMGAFIPELLKAFGKTKTLFKINFGMMIGKLVLVLYLSRYGLTAVVFSFVIINTITIAIYMKTLRGLISLNYSNLLGNLARTLSLCTIFIFTITIFNELFSKNIEPTTLTHLVLYNIITVSIFSTSVWLFLIYVFKHDAYGIIAALYKNSLSKLSKNA